VCAIWGIGGDSANGGEVLIEANESCAELGEDAARAPGEFTEKFYIPPGGGGGLVEC
jgi:hypothetical protein